MINHPSRSDHLRSPEAVENAACLAKQDWPSKRQLLKADKTASDLKYHSRCAVQHMAIRHALA